MSKLDTYAVGNATAWLKDRMANISLARKQGKSLRPFMMIVSIWNPHDMPIAYPGLTADPHNPTQWNMKNFMVEQVGGSRSHTIAGLCLQAVCMRCSVYVGAEMASTACSAAGHMRMRNRR